MGFRGPTRVWDNFLGQVNVIFNNINAIVSISVGLKKPCSEQLQKRKGLWPTKTRTRQYFEELTEGIYMFEIPRQLVVSREQFTARKQSTGVLWIPPQASLRTWSRLWYRAQAALPSGSQVGWCKSSSPSPPFAKKVLCNTELRQTHPPCGVSHLNVTPWNFLCRYCLWYHSVAQARCALKGSRIHPFSSYFSTRCTTDDLGFILLSTYSILDRQELLPLFLHCILSPHHPSSAILNYSWMK